MKYKVGDKVKIVDAVRGEDAIYGFKTGEVVTISGCCDGNQIYLITNGSNYGYINECSLTDLNSYTWGDFEKCPIGTKVTFESGKYLFKIDKDKYGDEFVNMNYNFSYEELENFEIKDTDFGKIIKIEEPTYTIVYEPTEEVEEMTMEEVCKALGKQIKIVKEK